MMQIDSVTLLLIAHVLQFSIAIVLVGLVLRLAGRRWPHFTFLLCMLALVKCLVPPLLPSPAGLFTINRQLAYQLDGALVSDIRTLQQKYASGRELNSPELAAGDSGVFALIGSQPWASIGWGRGLIAIWLIGAMVVVGAGHRRYRRTMHFAESTSVAVPASLTAMVDDLQRRLQMKRRPRIIVSSGNCCPTMAGLLRPTLILPEVLIRSWPDRLIRPIVTHEMVHARRGDMVWGCLQFAAQVVWWFHPLVWWLGRRAHLLCERCVDEETLAALKCSAADYAESIVEFMRLNQSLRPVLSGNGLSVSQMTTERLERLMKRCGSFRPRTPVTVWILTAVIAALVIPGASWVGAHEKKEAVHDIEKQSIGEVRTVINAALENEDWAAAESYLTEVTKNRPYDGRAAFLLGYVVHCQGRVEEALELHKRAAEFPSVRPTALYNWACALALMGNKEAALDKLTESFDEGFKPIGDLRDDADLESLFDDDRFQLLLNRPVSVRKSCDEPESRRAFDFWVGEWDVVNDDGRPLGRNTISISDKGHVITEKWQSATGSTGTSMNYYDAADDVWRQTWVDDSGSIIRYSGTFADGKMEMNGSLWESDGTKVATRMTLTPENNGSVRQLIETSRDNGKSWVVYFRGRYVPRSNDRKRST